MLGPNVAEARNATVLGLNEVDKQPDLILRLQDEADLCRSDGAGDIAALLDEAVEAIRDRNHDTQVGEKWREDSRLETWFPLTAERRKVEQVVLAELVLKTGELIEHLQKTGRLKPCFYMPALADARNALETRMADTHITIPMARLIELETAEHERDILRTNTQTLAMMLRKCAHRLKCNGHEDLSADVVGLLRRYGLLGSPLRGTEPEHG